MRKRQYNWEFIGFSSENIVLWDVAEKEWEQTTNLGVRSSNLFGRATLDEDGHYCFAVAL
jgi:hypothetical protein